MPLPTYLRDLRVAEQRERYKRGRSDDRYSRNPFAYDNRRDRGDWPEAAANINKRRRRKAAKVLGIILVVAALAVLWHTQTSCTELNGINSKLCVD